MRIVGTQPNGLLVVPQEDDGAFEAIENLPYRQWGEWQKTARRLAIGRLGLIEVYSHEARRIIFTGQNISLLSYYVDVNQHTLHHSLAEDVTMHLLDNRYGWTINGNFREVPEPRLLIF